MIAAAAVAAGVFVLVSLSRALGFGMGVLIGATPASGLAFGAALILRGAGAAGAAVGFAAAGLAWALAPAAAGVDGLAHGLAAQAAASAMRALARRRAVKSRTSDWLIFLTGVGLITGIVSLSRVAGPAAGDLGAGWSAATLTALFEPLGVFTFCAALFSLREFRRVLERPAPALWTTALAAFLLALLWIVLAAPGAALSPSGWTLMLSVPFCLWIAMQRRSLDGAALSFLAAHVALLMLLDHTGSILGPEYVMAVIYLNLLVATCQLVHAVNLDRLGALAEVEARKNELERRVAERTARFAAMTEKALAADAAKTRFLATVSHEVRTPLNGVLGMAQVVLAGDLDPQTRRHVEIIRTSGFHLLDVINRILDYSQIDGGRLPADHEAFDLGGVIDEVVREARFLPYAEDVRFEVDAPPGLALARRGYRHGLRQILTNLVGNAAKFTEKGVVTVRVREAAGDALRLEVRDTGAGVPPEDLDRIFLPFEQADAGAARTNGGTGLGLAICAEVVKRMGGRIGVESAVGEGSVFWVELPLPVAVPGEAGFEDASRT